MKIRDFNRGWEFHSDKSAEAQIVNLPHDAMLMENRDKSRRISHQRKLLPTRLDTLSVRSKTFMTRASYLSQFIV